MKKLMYLAAALLVMAGCKNNQNEPEAPIQGEAFSAGQHVTITVGDQLKAPVRKLNGTVTSTGIDFTWEANDSLFITVNGNTAIFHLTSGAGTSNGTFEGKMPAGGETFTAEYRGLGASGIEGGTQNYTANGIDMDFIHAKAENCVVAESSSSINLVVDNAAALILNLQCDKKVYLLSINEVEDGGKSPIRKGHGGVYTELFFGVDGLQLSASTPTKVAILLPEVMLDKKLALDFKAEDIQTPNFTLSNVELGGAVNYPLKKWVNLNLVDLSPDDGIQLPSTQLCAVGEKTTLCFMYRTAFAQIRKVTFKVGEHQIFSNSFTSTL